MVHIRSLSALAVLAAAALSRAGTFTDGFASGLDPSLYTVASDANAAYAAPDATHGDVRLAKLAGGNGGSTSQSVSLLASKIGGPFAGDFSATIDLTNSSAAGNGVNQIEFHAFFDDGSIFFDSYSNQGGTGGDNTVHVYNGSTHTYFPTTGSGGTFRIARVGSTVSGYFGSQLLYSETNAAVLSSLAFTVQSYTGTDAVSATYDNLSVTAPQAVPEPASFAALGLGACAMLRRRRK